LFSGSLYARALTDVSWPRSLAPVGGTALAAGWFALLGASRSPPADTPADTPADETR
jgi:uncharacterized membrane protein YgdD (TMEM256/DUF423 family)